MEEHTWFFGGGNENAQPGIRFDFATNQPYPFNEVRNPINLIENNIIISNPSNGEIRFYSDGKTIIDASHIAMPNGNELNGSNSSMYGTAVVLDPSRCNGYYVISVQGEDDAIPRKIFYSAVDMNSPGNGTLNDPLGDVDSSIKNIDITPAGVDCTEGIFSVSKSGATKDSWLFFGDRRNSILYLYQVTSSGIIFFNQFDLKSMMPSLPSEELFSIKMDFSPLSETRGILVVAPSRNIDNPTYPIGSFIFNNETGEIESNSYQLIDAETYWTYGTSFSSDGTKLYTSDYIGKTLKQFDFTTGILTTIATSPHIGRTGGLETGPDGRIYWSNTFGVQSEPEVSNLSVVNFPNLPRDNCDLVFNQWSIDAVVNPQRIGVLPTFGVFPDPPSVQSIMADKCSLGNGSAEIDPGESLPPLEYRWDNGETTATATNLDAGLHQISITDGLGCTEILEIFIEEENETLTPVIAGDLIICEEGKETTLLTGENGFDSYLWSNGEISPSTQITQPGTYTLSVTKGLSCSGETSVEVLERVLEVNIIGDSILCLGNYDSLILELDNSFEEYLWSNQSTESTISVNQSGEYAVSVISSEGCIAGDSISIFATMAPQISDIPEFIEVEYAETVELNPTIISEGAVLIEWTPSDNLSCDSCQFPTFLGSLENQNYQIHVADNFGCQDSSSVFITIVFDKSVFAPNAFSPNGDGSNDKFTLYGTSALKEIKSLQIFDRWGELIFNNENFPSNNENYGWSGDFKGEKLQPSVFIWQAEIEFHDGSTVTFNGDILLTL